MNLTIKFGTDHLDWRKVCQMLEAAPLGIRSPDRLRRAAESSYVVCSVYKGNRIVGFGRAISDGEYQSAIYDMAVFPEDQGQGIGKAIIEALLNRLPKGVIMLYTAPGKSGFYKKFGFWMIDSGMIKFHNP